MSFIDKAKVTIAGVIALAGIYLSLLQLVGSPVPLRFAIFFGSLGLAAVLMYFTPAGKEFVTYCRASALEVRKVVWPEREEVVKMTGVVLVFVMVVALFLWLVDSLLAWALTLLTL